MNDLINAWPAWVILAAFGLLVLWTEKQDINAEEEYRRTTRKTKNEDID